MKARDLRDLTNDEVKQRRIEVVKEKFNLTLRQATRQIDNPLKVRLLRRDLARIDTILREHELGIRKLADAVDEATVKDRQANDEE